MTPREPDKMAVRLTAEHIGGGLYRLHFPWPALHPPATYMIESREVGTKIWLTGLVTTAHEAPWRAPWRARSGWDVRVTAETQQDGRFRSEMVVLQDV